MSGYRGADTLGVSRGGLGGWGQDLCEVVGRHA